MRPPTVPSSLRSASVGARARHDAAGVAIGGRWCSGATRSRQGRRWEETAIPRVCVPPTPGIDPIEREGPAVRGRFNIHHGTVGRRSRRPRAAGRCRSFDAISASRSGRDTYRTGRRLAAAGAAGWRTPSVRPAGIPVALRRAILARGPSRHGDDRLEGPARSLACGAPRSAGHDRRLVSAHLSVEIERLQSTGCATRRTPTASGLGDSPPVELVRRRRGRGGGPPSRHQKNWPPSTTSRFAWLR
jgi:hypothetical protein